MHVSRPCKLPLCNLSPNAQNLFRLSLLEQEVLMEEKRYLYRIALMCEQTKGSWRFFSLRPIFFPKLEAGFKLEN